MADDRARWDLRYREGESPVEPSPFLVSQAELLPLTGRALDVAGGAGRNALWLARRGFEVTIVDFSEIAVDIVRTRATVQGLRLKLIVADLTAEPPPAGPWDVILCFHYLQRDLFPLMAAALAPGGVQITAQATHRNLERHERPPRPFLVDEGELPSLHAGLEIVAYDEGWFDDRHEARVVARKPA